MIASLVILAGLALVVGSMIGFVLSILAITSRQLTFRFRSRYKSAHIYAETFAVWLILFILLQLTAQLLSGGRMQLFLAGCAFVGSLVALGWPVLRGISFQQVRRDIGWTAGQNPLVEALCGIVGYICCFPIVMLGMVLVIVGVWLSKGMGLLVSGNLAFDKSLPTHPLAHELTSGDPVVLIGAFILACVCAPIIEETFFRGVLFRHLRKTTSRARRDG